MLLDHTEQYNAVWDKVYSELGFRPSMHEFTPFDIKVPHAVYGIENMTETQTDIMENIAQEIFARISNGRIYALDWQHSALLYDPRNPDEQRDFRVEDERYIGGGYNVCFPSFYPDGDYYFFIAEDFSFGWLGHPWRQEVWIFGEKLLHEIEAVYKSFGWTRK
ncbi:MAG: DUF2716 domain-containing protein [Ruminococcaceae bacterium]|nr:DUF2716 domain-containing protein [Oscillospiraceae bacterium]